jgi:N-acyl homoserine lactone hydrolase
MDQLKFSLLLALMALASCASLKKNDQADLRLFIFYCGELGYEDVSGFSLSNDETETRKLFVPCYLVDHPEGKMIWDAGLDPALAGQGKITPQPGTYMVYERSLEDQLEEVGVDPADVELIALSHMHFDHVGASRLFTNARLLIQRSEYEAAFLHPEDYAVFDYSQYEDLADNPRTILDGDHDVFGDGRVMLISAPGHTPGHQVLFIDLKNTGPLVLAGDLYHFRESRQLRRTPVFNTDAEQTLQSMDKVEAFIRGKKATLWIEHDKALADSLTLAPGSID